MAATLLLDRGMACLSPPEAAAQTVQDGDLVSHLPEPTARMLLDRKNLNVPVLFLHLGTAGLPLQ